MYDKAVKTPVRGGGVGWYSIGNEELEIVTELIKEPQKLWRYRKDSYSGRFESLACELTKAKYALFVNSGTSALACCLSGLGVGPGDEVIVSAYTYIATASACIEVGAVPVVCEIDNSLGLSPEDLENRITKHTKAVIVTHMQGVPARLKEIRAITKRRGLFLIEDCCQAVGARYEGQHCGVNSDAFAWSLNYYKNITCGEGGVFFTSSKDVFTKGYLQSDPAGAMWGNDFDDGSVLCFTRSGYRASELCGGVAYAQIQKLEGILVKTRALKKELLESLSGEFKHFTLQHIDDKEGDCGISFTMIANSKKECELLTQSLNKEGLSVGSAYSPDGFPDRHIFTFWEGIINKKGATDKNYPWGDPSYKGDVRYTKESCPQTLDILSRSLRISIHLGMTPQNMREFGEAINKADKSF